MTTVKGSSKRVKRLYKNRKLGGKCVKCGKRKGYDGTVSMCRPCADALRDKAREKRAIDPFYGVRGAATLRRQAEEFTHNQLDRIRDGLEPVIVTGETEDVP